jgi:hypothetical protein
VCHLILLLPLIALPVFWVWSLSWAVPTYALALLISGSTYYCAMAAMHRDISAGRASLAHARGKVVARSEAKPSSRCGSRKSFGRHPRTRTSTPVTPSR